MHPPTHTGTQRRLSFLFLLLLSDRKAKKGISVFLFHAVFSSLFFMFPYVRSWFMLLCGAKTRFRHLSSNALKKKNYVTEEQQRTPKASPYHIKQWRWEMQLFSFSTVFFERHALPSITATTNYSHSLSLKLTFPFTTYALTAHVHSGAAHTVATRQLCARTHRNIYQKKKKTVTPLHSVRALPTCVLLSLSYTETAQPHKNNGCSTGNYNTLFDTRKD